MSKNSLNDPYKNITAKKLERLAITANIPPGVRNIKLFADLINRDPTVAAKITEFGFENPKAIINYAKQLGFVFDKKDLTTFAEQMLDLSEELNDEELEMATGGFARLVNVSNSTGSSAYTGLIASAAIIATG